MPKERDYNIGTDAKNADSAWFYSIALGSFYYYALPEGSGNGKPKFGQHPIITPSSKKKLSGPIMFKQNRYILGNLLGKTSSSLDP